MDDRDYARRLFEILTDPSPTGIDPADPYGQADDGIDRHDGFGRDVRVESVDVQPGPHGAEIVVGFTLELPAELDGVPREGSTTLPFDAEWRALSGYERPEEYAPHVADRVMVAATSHVQRHRDGPRSAPHLPSRSAQRQLLLDLLRAEGAVTERGRDRYEVRPDTGPPLTVVVTPEQWEQVLAEQVGSEPELYIAELLGPRQDDERFVVFHDGDLARSTREELPPVRGRAFERRLADLGVETTDARSGWYAHAPDRVDSQSPGD